MATPTERIDLDLTHMARLLHDAYVRGDIEVICACWTRVDRLLDDRIKARRVTVPVATA